MDDDKLHRCATKPAIFASRVESSGLSVRCSSWQPTKQSAVVRIEQPAHASIFEHFRWVGNSKPATSARKFGDVALHAHGHTECGVWRSATTRDDSSPAAAKPRHHDCPRFVRNVVPRHLWHARLHVRLRQTPSHSANRRSIGCRRRTSAASNDDNSTSCAKCDGNGIGGNRSRSEPSDGTSYRAIFIIPYTNAVDG